MKLLTTITIATILHLSTASFSHAKPLVLIANPTSWAGTGCNASSISKTGTSKVFFESYDAGKDSQSGYKRTSCSFSIPITVPSGYQISQITTDWKGYVEGKARVSRKYFLSGQPYTSWKRNNYNKPSGGNFKKQDNIYHRSFAASCNGGVYNLRIHSEIKAIGKKSYVALKTVNLPNTVNLSLRLKPCQ